MGVDLAYQKFVSLKDELKLSNNIFTEADIRFQVIDRICKEVLEWENCDFSLEAHLRSGYADYLLKENGVNKLVIEAKRESVNLFGSKKDSVGYYLANGSVMKLAIPGMKQAQSYCLDTGVIFSIITNGIQWIGFWSIRENGKLPFEGKVIVFPSLSSIEDKFSIFYDFFSKEGIRDQLFKSYINEAEGLKIIATEKLEAPISPESIKLIKKSPLSSDIEIIFSDIAGDNDPDMLAKCFVESKESKEAEVGLEKIAINVLENIGLVDSDDGQERQDQIRISVERNNRDFVLIVGNKGAGKSTFIDRFFRIVIDNDLKSKCLLLRLDLANSDGNESNLNKWLSNYLVEELENLLFKSEPSYEDLQGVFFDDYNRWKNGELKYLYKEDKEKFKISFGKHIYELRSKEPHTYAIKLLTRAVKSDKKLPCIVFDNTDHYPKSFQEKVFQHAQSINRAVLSFIICPITDKTVWQLSKSGPFQSYYSHSFYLPVPQSKDILKKRVSYLRTKVEEEEKKDKKDYTLNKGMRLQINDLKGFVYCIEEIFVNTNYVSRTISLVIKS